MQGFKGFENLAVREYFFSQREINLYLLEPCCIYHLCSGSKIYLFLKPRVLDSISISFSLFALPPQTFVSSDLP